MEKKIPRRHSYLHIHYISREFLKGKELATKPLRTLNIIRDHRWKEKGESDKEWKKEQWVVTERGKYESWISIKGKGLKRKES